MSTMVKVVLPDQIDQKTDQRHHQDQLDQLKVDLKVQEDLPAQEDHKRHHTLPLKLLLLLVYHKKISMHISLTKQDY